RRADQGYHRNLTAASPKYALAIRLRREVLELGVLAQKCQLQIGGGTVALLGNNDVRDAFARRILVVYLFPINQENEVAILFNSSAVMADDAVGQRPRRAWIRHVESLFLAFEADGDHTVPEEIGPRPNLQCVVIEQIDI